MSSEAATLGVTLNRDRLNEALAPESFATDEGFAVELHNEGEPVHVHLRFTGPVADATAVETSNHYVDAGRTLAVPVRVARVDDPVEGTLRVVTGHGADGTEVAVRVDPRPRPSTSTSRTPVPGRGRRRRRRAGARRVGRRPGPADRPGRRRPRDRRRRRRRRPRPRRRGGARARVGQRRRDARRRRRVRRRRRRGLPVDPVTGGRAAGRATTSGYSSWSSWSPSWLSASWSPWLSPSPSWASASWCASGSVGTPPRLPWSSNSFARR